MLITKFKKLIPLFPWVLACGTATTGTTTPPADDGCDGDVCVLSGPLVQNKTLTADKRWLLRGGVFVGNDVDPVTLTVEAGTHVFGESSTNGMLIVSRGARIMAQGTAAAPIVFTSSKVEGTRARGDWGGVIINGRAPINGCTGTAVCEGFGEGGTGYYGGNDAQDNSGVLSYVRIEFAGRLISPENELNGLALQAVGSQTTLDFIQVHMAKDDCLEFFGGTANARHILCTGVADDNLDWTDGWVGKVQFLVAQQYEDAGDNGIEGDNSAENNSATPRSHPTIANVTLIGSRNSEQSDLGILLREGTAANLSNVIVTGFNEACLDVDHAETFSNGFQNSMLTGELTISHSILDCATNFLEDAGEPVGIAALFTLNEANLTGDPGLMAPFSFDAPNFKPMPGSAAITSAQHLTDAFFTQVDFRGGVDPAADWTEGWTISRRD